MKQKKIVIIMAGILAAAAAMTGCAEQNKTATQVDYTQNAQGKSEQAKQKTAEKSQPDKKQVNKSTSGGKENSNQAFFTYTHRAREYHVRDGHHIEVILVVTDINTTRHILFILWKTVFYF